MKKLMTLLLALALVMLTLSGAALAEETAQDAAAEVAEAVEAAEAPAAEEPAEAAESAEKKATVMIYMCGADLESRAYQGSQTMAEINQSGVNTDAVNVVALLGGATHWSRGYDTHKLTLVEIGKRRPKVVDELDLMPMSEPETLTQFLDLCKDRYPAEKFYLVVWDHGGGPNQGVCQDFLFHYDTLTLNEMEKAFQDSVFGQGGLEIIAFNTCLTGSLEYTAKLSPFARYMVATEDSMYGMGYDWLSSLDTDDDALTTAVNMVDQTYALNERAIAMNNATEINSVSLVDLAKIPALVQAMDVFFPLVTPEVNNADFTAVSQHRKESTTFGVSESGGDSNRDLVDLGDLVLNLREYAPEAADALLAALGEAVVYKRSVNDQCYGLTVYHPYANKARLQENMSVHNALGVSEGYSAYIQQFAAMMTDTPLADWSELTTDVPAANKDNRTLFTLALSPEQAGNLADARLYVLLKHEDGTYSFTFENTNCTLAEDRITSEFSGTALYAVSEDGPISAPLGYEITETGAYRIPATLVREGVEDMEDFEAEAQIICTLDRQTKQLTPGSVLLKDESGYYTSIYNMQWSDFTGIRLPILRRSAPQASDGALNRFADWKVADTDEWSAPIDGSWSFQLVNDTLDPTQLYACFQIADSQSNWYSSQSRVVKAGMSGADEVRVEYDDLNLVLINDFSLTHANDMLTLAATLTNLTDREVILSLRQLTMNGIPMEETTEVYGGGGNWGLMPEEAQHLGLPVPASALDGAEALTDVTFVLAVRDAETGEAVGEVPVTVTLRLEL